MKFIGYITICILVVQIRLIPDEQYLDIFVRIVLHLEQPLVDVLKGASPGDVENQKGRHRAFVVGAGD